MGRKKKGAAMPEKVMEMVNQELKDLCGPDGQTYVIETEQELNTPKEETHFFSDMDNALENIARRKAAQAQEESVAEEPMEQYLNDLVAGQITPCNDFDGEPTSLPDGRDETEEPIPAMSSPEWTEYVMSKFVDGEIVNSHPTASGLRRVTELLLGPIVRSSVKIVQTPNQDNGMHAVAEYTVGIQYDFEVREFTAAADANLLNTDAKFSIYPTALAETRAKGRAFREALRLSKCAAEEVYVVPEDEDEKAGRITASQISFLDMLASPQRLNVDVWSLINSKKRYEKLSDISYTDAQKMCKRLSDLQRTPQEIPEFARGKYKENWAEAHK